MYIAEVDDSTCIGCGACVSDCPQNVYTLDGVSVVNDDAECINCQTCVAVCPAGAITINEY